MNSNLANIIYEIDKEVRNDLVNRYIVSERDYMSTLTTYIRAEFKPPNKYPKKSNNNLNQSIGYSFCYSQVLPSNNEQIFGCDIMIVVRHHQEKKIKILLIEAKYPKIFQSNNIFNFTDEFDHQKQKSHFDIQLETQKNALNKYNSQLFGICEMFIVDAKMKEQNSWSRQNLKLDDYGSSLIWHQDIWNYYQKYRTTSNRKSKSWQKKELERLFDEEKNNFKNIEKILKELLNSNQIKWLPLEKKEDRIDKIILKPSLKTESNSTIEIPIPTSDLQDERNLQNEFQQEFDQFLKSTGLKNFLYIHLQED